jgi:oxygen-dependent protoporphyrinogen oxidase
MISNSSPRTDHGESQVDALDLKAQMIGVPKTSTMPRLIYYPDHLVDITPPKFSRSDVLGSAVSFAGFMNRLWDEPLLEGIVPSVLGAAVNWNRLPATPGSGPFYIVDSDTSIGNLFKGWFLGRQELVDNLISAVVHGIYGGDVWKLSAESGVFSRLLAQTALGRSAGMTLLQIEDLILASDVAHDNEGVRDLFWESKHWQYLSFTGGFNTLTDALATKLKQDPRVSFRLGEAVSSIKKLDDQKIEVRMRLCSTT